jgi:hypothetical protein
MTKIETIAKDLITTIHTYAAEGKISINCSTEEIIKELTEKLQALWDAVRENDNP